MSAVRYRTDPAVAGFLLRKGFGKRRLDSILSSGLFCAKLLAPVSRSSVSPARLGSEQVQLYVVCVCGELRDSKRGIKMSGLSFQTIAFFLSMSSCL